MSPEALSTNAVDNSWEQVPPVVFGWWNVTEVTTTRMILPGLRLTGKSMVARMHQPATDCGPYSPIGDDPDAPAGDKAGDKAGRQPAQD